jgi:hypothetical protein
MILCAEGDGLRCRSAGEGEVLLFNVWLMHDWYGWGVFSSILWTQSKALIKDNKTNVISQNITILLYQTKASQSTYLFPNHETSIIRSTKKRAIFTFAHMSSMHSAGCCCLLNHTCLKSEQILLHFSLLDCSYG